MKKLTLYTVLFFSAVCGFAQTNLVPNPSFEDTVSCPINGFITNCSGWQPYSSSPDYFNSCVPSWYVYSVPDNLHGYQLPASGQAYSGIYTYVEGETDYSLNREILGNNLISPLSIGQKYYVSLKVSLGTNMQNTGHSLANNKIGVLFSTLPYSNTNATTIPPIENFAHIYTDSIITDSIGWTTIFGSFTSDSVYNYISVGNFFKIEVTDTIHVINNNPFTPNAYYYVDDICVSTDSLFCANYVYTGIKEENMVNEINIYPNPSNGSVKVKMQGLSTSSIKVFNSLGQQVFFQDLIIKESLDLSNLVNGIYYIVITNGKKQYSTKLLIQK